jgi:hypothetical protein
MNWKLIVQLSMFGLAMGLGTVFLIPSNIEPFFWLPIFIVCAYLIAKQAPGKPFLHGLLLGLANCIWITAAHILFVDRYLANHPNEARMMTSMPATASPQVAMAVFGPIVGLVSGCVIGILALLVAKILKSADVESRTLKAKR